jgi:hypothetical protein
MIPVWEAGCTMRSQNRTGTECADHHTDAAVSVGREREEGEERVNLKKPKM